MVPKINASKRLTAHKRYKIDRKVREHNRKLRKEKRLNPKKLKKDPGIPNLWPFKDKLLKEIEERKQQVEEEKQKKHEDAKQRKLDLASLKRSAEQRTQEFELNATESMEGGASAGNGTNDHGRIRGDNSRKAYYKEFKKVLEAADVILEVLDARDPIGCRSKQIEELIMSSGTSKKIILVLNKIDLVPREIAEKWLKYLRNEFPTIAFKASTQTQRKNIGHVNTPVDIASDDMLNSSECLGADNLIKLLKNYCRNLNIKTSISVGVIGFPNVGKSSIINSLKRSKACGVGAMPGFTKTVQEIHLDKHIKLLDCPGIIFATGTSEADVLLRNCIKVENIEDPITAVGHLLTRIDTEQMMSLYTVPAFGGSRDFLAHLARQRGKLKKGGIPDLELAGRMVLQDWNSGKIPYFTEPPKETRLLDAAVVAKYSKEFSIEDLVQAETADLATLVSQKDGSFVAMKPSEQLDVDMDDEEEDDDDDDDDAMDYDDDEEDDEDMMDEDDELPDDEVDEDEDAMDDDSHFALAAATKKGKGSLSHLEADQVSSKKGKQQPQASAPQRSQQKVIQSSIEASLNPQVNRDRKKSAKQEKRALRRSHRETVVDDDGDDDGTYSFDRDFVQ